jgi:predicted ATPase
VNVLVESRGRLYWIGGVETGNRVTAGRYIGIQLLHILSLQLEHQQWQSSGGTEQRTYERVLLISSTVRVSIEHSIQFGRV